MFKRTRNLTLVFLSWAPEGQTGNIYLYINTLMLKSGMMTMYDDAVMFKCANVHEADSWLTGDVGDSLRVERNGF